MKLIIKILLIGTVIIGLIPSKITVINPSLNEIVTAEITDEEYVRQEFKGVPIMIEVARCESTFRQLDKNFQPLRGIENPKDVGLFQINEDYHLARAKKLGIDIYTREGNVLFAKLLYKEQGVQPWAWSNSCHKGLNK